ncbi:uroporphyrin-3 C-methyltransferase [Rhodoferax sp. OV413]|uniref:uroporphyrinogen-III C-methyltransferase n=1 Tax=Rhodoferax sp. OV413 TaxID=1855285 RepID=UPI000885F81E|nr:uroporphyrinogen-III C-methyltransferase [Rhodoferax sp. OV413]SDP18945.1 uroporphyrin-3 C-methyltransferase [Rhodoferax sp. OV413]
MNAELPPESAAPPTPSVTPPSKGSSKSTLVVAGVAVLALASSGMLWQKLSSIQEHLARQSADAGAQAVEARTMARQAQDQARETAAHQAVTDARISETTLQRSQLEDLMQSLSRSRDENLVVDIESSVRLAQQQAQLTGSVEPLLAALKTADDRVSRAAQPRLAPLQRAIARDTDRIKSASTTDTPGLLIKLDELVRQVDELPTVNAVVAASAVGADKTTSGPAASEWWQRWLDLVHQEARKLLRVSRIEQPEAALLSPEQSFFLRENLKLKLLNARLGLLARQLESSRADLAAATAALNKYFDPSSRKTQNMATLLQQVQSQMKSAELPRVDETLAALATAAAGR